jgi:hypothetical protein
MNLIQFRKSPVEVYGGNQTTILHVGAIYNKLDELKGLLIPLFDQEPKFDRIPCGRNNEDTVYQLSGFVEGVEHEVSLEYLAFSIPLSMAQIHHASVKLSEEKEDKLTPVIEREFRIYEHELEQRLKEHLRKSSGFS